MIRLGLCCKFHEVPIRFRTTTVTTLERVTRAVQLERLSGLARDNAAALQQALSFCAEHQIGCFRVNSQILPVKTHPRVGYAVDALPGADAIIGAFRQCGAFARERGIRITFHPDQFVLLSARDTAITRSSLAELEYQAEVADWLGADVINLHAGGAYGDKTAALARMAAVVKTLPRCIRDRLTFENDDRVYTPADLLPFCRAHRIPFVYDVHHHRCRPDGQSVAEVTRQALDTWDREPLFHLSSSREAGPGQNPRPHHDFIALSDFPVEWYGLDITVEVEAKAKEQAVARLRRALIRKGVGF